MNTALTDTTQHNTTRSIYFNLMIMIVFIYLFFFYNIKGKLPFNGQVKVMKVCHSVMQPVSSSVPS